MQWKNKVKWTKHQWQSKSEIAHVEAEEKEVYSTAIFCTFWHG